MKIEYEPPKEVTYTTTERFSVYCENTGIGMLIYGNTIRFVGNNRATCQWDEYGFDRYKLTTELLLKFVEAYNNRGKDAG